MKKNHTPPARTAAILQRISVDLVIHGAEIGVYRAWNAVGMLTNRPLLQLLCVDSWCVYPGDYIANDPLEKCQDWEPNYQEAMIQLQPFDARVKIMHQFSVDAAKEIDDGSLDFVFIDARHQSPWVDQDIEAWRSKVKPGGWIGGHDYNHGNYPDVIKAVTFAAQKYQWHVETDIDWTWFVRL